MRNWPLQGLHIWSTPLGVTPALERGSTMHKRIEFCSFLLEFRTKMEQESFSGSSSLNWRKGIQRGGKLGCSKRQRNPESHVGEVTQKTRWCRLCNCVLKGHLLISLFFQAAAPSGWWSSRGNVLEANRKGPRLGFWQAGAAGTYARSS